METPALAALAALLQIHNQDTRLTCARSDCLEAKSPRSRCRQGHILPLKEPRKDLFQAFLPASGSSLAFGRITEAVEQESDTRVNSPKRLSFLLSVVLNGFLKVTVHQACSCPRTIAFAGSSAWNSLAQISTWVTVINHLNAKFTFSGGLSGPRYLRHALTSELRSSLWLEHIYPRELCGPLQLLQVFAHRSPSWWNNSYRTPTERWQKTSDLPKGKKLPTYLGRAKEKRKNRDKTIGTGPAPVGESHERGKVSTH
ncbi:uncharacterized protein LOC132495108 isoform X2 [Mesoplodon densirostris]|uniref:uncharacterized protein LOC132495108 isoform X2 n=1 Tax=Mesoplodon densirostris TaxID=48708 RepID=UPI0028DCADDA|nr:uncharacterized protein LOC132495108 isoform X2 [Mesoplodon densirostris]